MNIALPVISGTAQDGATLTVSDGSWTGTPPLSFTYQWESCDADGASCADIAGASGEDLLLGADNVGHTVRVELTASNASGYLPVHSDATPVIVSHESPPPPLALDLSVSASDKAGGLTFADEDVVGFDGTGFSTVFDGSDTGLGPANVDALAIVSRTTILMSFARPVRIARLGTVDDSDVVRFRATSLGWRTVGTFSPYFDGSDVGLTTDAEDVDAIELRGGRLLVSTRGRVSVPRLAGRSADLLAFRPKTLGMRTQGGWKMYFDGSDVGLTERGENVDGVMVADNGDILLSTSGRFSVPGRAGRNEDVCICTPSSLGLRTRCAYAPKPGVRR